MKKNIKLAVYPLLIFTAAVLAAGSLRSLSEDRNTKAYAEGMIQYDSLDTYAEYDCETSDTIDIIFNGESITVKESYRYSEPTYILTVSGTDRYITGTQYYVKNGNSVTIDYDKPYGLLEVILPKDYRYSGINISAPQANIYLENLDTQQLTASTASGSVSCDSVYADRIVLRNNGGSVYISDTSADVLQITTKGGNINAAGSCSECYLTTVSGNITYSPDDLYVRADLTSDSGDIRFTADDTSNAEISVYECGNEIKVSEEYGKTDYSTYVIGEGYISVNIKTSKGNVILETK